MYSFMLYKGAALYIQKEETTRPKLITMIILMIAA